MSRGLGGSGQAPTPIAKGTKLLVGVGWGAEALREFLNEVGPSHGSKRVHRAKLGDSLAGPAQMKNPGPLIPVALKGMCGLLNGHLSYTFPREVFRGFNEPRHILSAQGMGTLRILEAQEGTRVVPQELL